MFIKSIMNNNAILAINDSQKEVIVRGSGIGFKKSIGDMVDLTKIEKTYILTNSEVKNRLEQLLNTVSDEYFEISDEIIILAKTRLEGRLNDMIYVNLTDHIAQAVNRYREGIMIANPLLTEIKNFYEDEYKIGEEALDIVKKRTNISLNEDEIGFIALHLINAQLKDSGAIGYKITNLLQEILTIVANFFETDFDKESIHYYRFVTHLKYFAQRLFSNKTRESQRDDELFLIIKEKYSNSYSCTQSITTFILKTYDYNISQEEELYLTIHIEKLTSELTSGF